MAALDDDRLSDTVPPLTLRQILQIIPFIIFLRKYAPCRPAPIRCLERLS